MWEKIKATVANVFNKIKEVFSSLVEKISGVFNKGGAEAGSQSETHHDTAAKVAAPAVEKTVAPEVTRSTAAEAEAPENASLVTVASGQKNTALAV